MQFPIEDEHRLLESRPLPYSNVTVRRAFMTWLHCGSSVEFKQVCNYYHRLELLEDTMPQEKRALSRYKEFNMYSNTPPQSAFLKTHFPKLYCAPSHAAKHVDNLEKIRNETFIFNLKGFRNIDFIGSSKKEINLASVMVRSYCAECQISPSKFLEEVNDYLVKTRNRYTVKNVLMYLKKKALQAELIMIENMPKYYDFLDIDLSEPMKEDTGVKKAIKIEPTDVDKAKDNSLYVRTEDTEGAKAEAKKPSPKERKSRTVAVFPISPKSYKEYYPLLDPPPGEFKVYELPESAKITVDNDDEEKVIEDCNDEDDEEVVEARDDDADDSSGSGESGIDCMSSDDGEPVVIIKNNGMADDIKRIDNDHDYSCGR